MDLEIKKRIWKVIAIITFPVWIVLASALLYLVIVILSIVGGFLMLIGKNPFKFEAFDFSDMEFDEL